jgi:hypothetical protein
MLHEFQLVVLVQHLRINQIFPGIPLQLHLEARIEEPIGNRWAPSHVLCQTGQRDVELELKDSRTFYVQENLG